MITNSCRWSKVWIGVFSFLLPLSTFLFTACSSKPSQEESARAEQLMEAAHKAKDYQKLMAQADSLEKAGCLSTAKAYYWRGYASDRTNRHRMVFPDLLLHVPDYLEIGQNSRPAHYDFGMQPLPLPCSVINAGRRAKAQRTDN